MGDQGGSRIEVTVSESPTWAGWFTLPERSLGSFVKVRGGGGSWVLAEGSGRLRTAPLLLMTLGYGRHPSIPQSTPGGNTSAFIHAENEAEM